MNRRQARIFGRAAWPLAAVACIVIALALGGCSSPTKRVIIVNGVEMVERLDERTNPCGDTEGCWTWRDGKHHVYYKSTSPNWVRTHEQCHALGMRHTEWRRDFTGTYTATVTAPACHYKTGQRLTMYWVNGTPYEVAQ